MLQRVDLAARPLDRYTDIVGANTVAELRKLAEPLSGRRVAHINATSYGGGVSELPPVVVIHGQGAHYRRA